MMLKYALFLGCLIPNRYPQIEAASRFSFRKLGVDVEDMEGVGCCPDPVGIRSIDERTWLLLAARNLCIGEEMGKNILTLCSGCYETLNSVNVMLKAREELRSDVNSELAKIGKKFKGEIEVRNLLQALEDDVGVENIRRLTVRPLNGLRVASHYGCHLTKPSSLARFDDPEKPSVLDRLISAVGAESVPYLNKLDCCGVGLSSIDSDTSTKILEKKLTDIQNAKAECMALVCPFCYGRYDLGQVQLARQRGVRFEIPVLYYSQLLAYALGAEPDSIGLQFNYVRPKMLLDR